MGIIRRCIEIEEYVPGKSAEWVRKRYGLERVVKLASNENPYGVSPKVVEAIRTFCDHHSLSVYPDPEYEELRSGISEYTGWEYERIVVGAGEDGILETIFRLLVDEGDEIVIPTPTFPYYRNLVLASCGREIDYTRGEGFKIGEDITDLITSKTKLILISTPNNPTGNVEDEDVLRAIVETAEEKKAIVYIDEAYVEFADGCFSVESENVVVGRTFSKAFGLANLRIGYAKLPEWMIKPYRSVSTPFPVSTLAEKAAVAALNDLDWMREVVEKIKRERERLYSELSKILEVNPSKANFLFFRSPSDDFVEEMMKFGVILREFKLPEGRYVRVSVGKREENDFFLESLYRCLKCE